MIGAGLPTTAGHLNFLCYTADELLKGPVYNITEDDTIEISIGDYDIGGDEMKFYCTEFRTEGISFEIPEE